MFVNGYRFNAGVTEHPNSDNVVVNSDRHNYWEGVDYRFAHRLKSGTSLYADGHHSIKTSNHRDMLSFYNSAKHTIRSSSDLKEMGIKLGGTIEHVITNSLPAPISAPITLAQMASAYAGGKLNADPNPAGFNERRMNGQKAGRTLLADIASQKVRVQRDPKNNIIDTLDIVAHSMGYAYALGMADVLKNKIPVGRFYIIAPENACSGDINLNDFEEVWQYGSNLGEPNEDPLHEQDGVAPQCAVKGLDDIDPRKGGRTFIPKDEPKGFLQSHSIGNYKWILRKIENEDGYVKPRK